MIFDEIDILLQIYSYLLMEMMRLDSFEDPFEI